MKTIQNNVKAESQNGIKNAQGITLVALVVTIVVLLILAGITIAALFSDNGIISAAQKAKTDTESAVSETEQQLKNLAGDLSNVLNNNVSGKKEENALPKKDGITAPYLPASNFKQVEGTSLENGLVISDNIENGVSTGNEYVWIEVPTTDEVYKITKSKKDVATLTDDDLKNIETDLREYSKAYQGWYNSSNAWQDKSAWKDTYHASLNDATNGKVVAIESESKYNELKNQMLKSVYEHGGFWIGRYEAGIDTARTANTDSIANDLVPLSKANKEPLTYVTRNQAQMLASRVLEGHSSLMFGVQWDLVLKYLETKLGASNLEDSTSTKTNKNILISDSTSWGNYENATFDYTNISGQTVSKSGSTRIPTGSSTHNKKQNIYDLAGNVREWTLEYTSNVSNPCASRGGYYYDDFDGSSYPASYRFGSNASISYDSIGLRLTLY